MARERILVVDDEPGVRSALEAILRDEGFTVVTSPSGEEGLAALAASPFDAVLLDVWLPGIDGIETLQRIRETRLDAEVVMISGHGTIETAVRATKLGAFDFVEKPLSLEKTLLVLRNALRQRRLERRNRHLLDQLSVDTEILGRSAAARRLRAEVTAAASTESPVLICGERGSGCETVARRIHLESARAGEAFVLVPCAALDARSATEILFGGPGAPGRIHLADGGSLFLEEVERLPVAVQDRLGALLGTRADFGPDVRWLGSSTRDPSSIGSTLRQQLDGLRLMVAPLRERREDVPVLAERFARSLSKEYGRPEKRFAPDCLAALTAYGWPGNVRELRNLVERLVLLVPGEEIRILDLPPPIGAEGLPAEDLYAEFATLAEGLETFERYYVRRVLTESQGDRQKAARRLGIDAGSLEKRMRALALS